MPPQRLDGRHGLNLPRLPERRAFLDAQPQIDTEDHEDRADQKWDTPAPGQQVRFRQPRDRQRRKRGQDHTDRSRRLDHGSREAAPIAGRGFDRHEDRRGRLAPSAKP